MPHQTSPSEQNASTRATIDLNCDMGESSGVYTLGNDAELIKYATSVNIACGFHAGDARVMRETILLAIQHGVSIGAHPGLPDKEGFGRREMQLSAQEVYDITLYQISALYGMTTALGGTMTHVKPHGALYNMMAKPTQRAEELAEACVDAVFALNPDLVFVGLAQSTMTNAAQQRGLRTIHEAFADRRYETDGTLTPRSNTNALLHDHREASEQAVSLALRNEVRTREGVIVPVRAQTLCLHGDSPDAVPFAQAIVRTLAEAGITTRPFAHIFATEFL